MANRTWHVHRKLEVLKISLTNSHVRYRKMRRRLTGHSSIVAEDMNHRDKPEKAFWNTTCCAQGGGQVGTSAAPHSRREYL